MSLFLLRMLKSGTRSSWNDGVLQNQPYTLGQSIADIIDNSYDANAPRLMCVSTLTHQTQQTYIVIMDNGDGISEDDKENALRLGVRRNRSDTELGVFGIGMKSLLGTSK